KIVELTRTYNSDQPDKSGFTVRVPRDPTDLPLWDGAVYLAVRERLTSGSLEIVSQYIIDGDYAYAGGFTAAKSQEAKGKNADRAGRDAAISAAVGDPVDVANGNMYRDETDLALPGIGLPVAFARRYNAQSAADVGFGVGWTHSFSDSLRWEDADKDGDVDVVWTAAKGERYVFKLQNGAYVNPPTLFGTLSAAGGLWTYEEKDGVRRTFERFGDRARLSEIADRNGNKLKVSYDARGRIATVTDVTPGRPPAVKLTFGYAQANRQTVTDAFGRTWLYDFRTLSDGRRHLVRVESPSDHRTAAAVTLYAYENGGGKLQGLMTRIVEPDGGAHTYTYYANGRAFEVTDAEGHATSMSFNLYRNLTYFADERGFVTRHVYDEQGLLLRKVYADRTREDYLWQNSLMASMTDPLGRKTEYTHANGNLVRQAELVWDAAQAKYVTRLLTQYDYHPTFRDRVTLRVVDADSDPARLGQAKPASRVTGYGYDAAGNLTSVVEDPDRTGYDGLGLLTTMTYGDRGRLETRTSPRGTATADPGDFVTRYDYGTNALGLVERQVLPDLDGVGVGAPPPEVVFTYDAYGNIATRRDPTGVVTAYVYDLLGRRVEERLPDPDGGGPLGELVTRFAYDPLGRLVAVTDPRGQVTARVYDRKGNLVETRAADGTAARFEYDGANNLVKSVDATGRVTATVFDARNRAVLTLHADGATEGVRYDGEGRVTQTRDGRGNVTTFAYDAAGRLSKTTDAAGGSETYAYDAVGNRVKVTDPLGRVTESVYDKLNRVVQVRAWRWEEGVTPATPAVFGDYDVVATTDYDANGNAWRTIRWDVTGSTVPLASGLAAVPAEKQRIDLTTFDAHDRPTAWQNAEGGVRTVVYDAAGRVLKETDELLRETRREYDAAGRLLREVLRDADLADGVARHLVRTFTADAAGNVTHVAEQEHTADAAGALTPNPAVPPRVTERRYDALGRLTHEVLPDPDGAGPLLAPTTVFAYDAAGRTVAVVDPLGHATLTAYDARGRRSRVVQADPDGTGTQFAPVTRYAYDAAGNLDSVTDPLGRTTEYEYDALNRKSKETLPDPDGLAGSQAS
ncbi:MAG TPA: DUF6531 domain-containing protein, partial [Planctomycetaceae bacterium]